MGKGTRKIIGRLNTKMRISRFSIRLLAGVVNIRFMLSWIYMLLQAGRTLIGTVTIQE